MNYDNGTTNGVFAAFFLVFAAISGLMLLIAIAYYVVLSISLMSFFRKVGVKPWIAWVPIYNTWVRLEIGGQPGWISLLSLVSPGGIITAVFLYIGMYRTGFAFRKDGTFLVLGIFLPFVWAFMLGGRDSVYEPELITALGYPPPLAGFGASRPNWADQGYQPPNAPGFAAPPAA